MRSDIEFQSEGATLRGLLYLPEAAATRPPLVIMGHGFSATVFMVADKYAEAFSRAGFAVLLYDHRNLGRSGGEPRGELNPWVQCRGFRDAISFAETLVTIDQDRIALWGDSWAGALVMVVGAVDSRVKAIIAQIPGCGPAVPPIEPSELMVKLPPTIWSIGRPLVRASADFSSISVAISGTLLRSASRITATSKPFGVSTAKPI